MDGPDEEADLVDDATARIGAPSIDGWEVAEAIPVGPGRLLEDQAMGVEWLPLVPSSRLRPFWIGPTREGDWVQSTPLSIAVERRRALLFADRFDPSFRYALPILEMVPSDVAARVVEAAGRHGLDGPATWARFPRPGLVRSGLRSRRAQWVAPALDWLAAVPAGIDVGDELRAVADDPDLPPDLRLRARHHLAAL